MWGGSWLEYNLLPPMLLTDFTSPSDRQIVYGVAILAIRVSQLISIERFLFGYD